jgi:hypothetical protein
VGVNIPESWLLDAASVLNYKLGCIPFLYLGLPIDGDERHLPFMSGLVDKIRCKLSLWKSHHLSMGGRLVLIKFVMSPISVYFLSFSKAPTCIIYLIESILKAFIWAECEESGKTN